MDTEETLAESEQIQFRASAQLAQTLRDRAGADESANLIARLDLVRYHHLLWLARQDLIFTSDEIALIADANNGDASFAAVEDDSGAGISPLRLWANVADYPTPSKWNHDEATHWALIARLRALPAVQVFALADAIERFWASTQQAHHADIFRALGLQIVDEPADEIEH